MFRQATVLGCRDDDLAQLQAVIVVPEHRPTTGGQKQRISRIRPDMTVGMVP